jgi:hypothetical protein
MFGTGIINGIGRSSSVIRGDARVNDRPAAAVVGEELSPPFSIGTPKMRWSHWWLPFWIAALAHGAFAADHDALANPAIDMEGFLRVANETAAYRASRRLSEDQFIRMSRVPGTVILDARSREKFDALHVRGAVNLSFPDIAIDSLAQSFPDKNTRILIYCNNNFVNADDAFPSKLPAASLNLSTFIALYNYGYRNVYELGPLLDVTTTRIRMESSPARR